MFIGVRWSRVHPPFLLVFSLASFHTSKSRKNGYQAQEPEACRQGAKALYSGGLYIHVSPAGGKLWRLFYRFDGKQKPLALGKYPEVSLAEARKRRDEARALNESCP